MKTAKSTKQAKFFRYYYWKKHQEIQEYSLLSRGITFLKKFFTLLQSSFQQTEKISVHKDIASIQQETSSKIFVTAKGEAVKSRMEKEIADFLYTQKIKYQYEKPCILSNGKVIRPDFYLEDYDVYIEYFGMLGNPKYNFTIALKKETFEKEQMKVIELYPNNFRKLGIIIKKRFEEVTHKTFPQRVFIPTV